MFKTTIEYTNYNGENAKEDCYFNFSKADLLEMQWSDDEGLDKILEKIVKESRPSVLMPVFKEMVLKSYGIKSEDGRRFIKSDKLSEEFSQTPAFSELLVRLCTDADFSADFVNNIIPKNIENESNVGEKKSVNE